MAKDVQSAMGKMGGASKPKMPPKVLEHIRIHPKMGGGVSVAHHYTAYEHQPKMHNFGADEAMAFHEHVATHTGMPMDSNGETNTDMPAGEK
jgi:hypothetical protein